MLTFFENIMILARFFSISKRIISIYYFIILCVCSFSLVDAVFIQRFSTTNNGGISFTGNTLGLSKLLDENQAGDEDSIGAFITNNPAISVPTFPAELSPVPAGTTLIFANSLSAATLDLPPNSTVLYAELVWSGGYGWGNTVPLASVNTPVTFITPQNNVFAVNPDPATAQSAVTPGFMNMGNYVRSANVTSIVQAAGAGQYKVGAVPATIVASDNTHNAAGWTLAVVYQNPNMLTSNLTLFVGCEQASDQMNAPAEVSGFCVPPTGTQMGRLFVSAIEGDANKVGDRLLFGPTAPLSIAANSISGTNNPINNFFGSQLNTILPLVTDPNGKLIPTGSGQLDTRGSFGDRNQNILTATNIVAGRQGYDITTVDISSVLMPNQTTAFTQGTIGPGGDDYTLNCLGVQIQVDAPILLIEKRVNGQINIDSKVGDVVTFTVNVQNVGTTEPINVFLQDILEQGLSLQTVSVNGVPVSPDQLSTTGVPIGSLPATVEFTARIDSFPATGNTFFDTATVNYGFVTCFGQMQSLTAISNEVSIRLPIIIINDQETTPENTMLHGGSVLRNDSGCDLVVISFTQPVVPGSSVNVQPDGMFDYMPALDFVGTDSFTYTVQDCSGQTATGTVTIIVTPLEDILPPQNFKGNLTKCRKLNGTDFILRAKWTSPSPNVLSFRIYRKNKVVAEISANECLHFTKCLNSKKDAREFSITAVYPNNVESEHVKIRIKHD